MSILSVVLPVYNNEATISDIFEEIRDVCQSLNNESDFYEIVMVNDGSSDRSWEVMTELNLRYGVNCKIINLTRNFGQLNALLAGFTFASGKAIVSMSADGQDPPHLIKDFVQKWDDGELLVVAQRVSRRDGFLKDRISKVGWELLRHFAVPNIPVGGFDYFLMDRELCDYYVKGAEQSLFMQGRLLFYGVSPCVLPYARESRREGRSQTSFARRIQYFIDGFTSYSLFPLRCITFLGIVALCVALFLVMIITVAYFILDSKVEGWASLFVLNLLIGGVQLFSLGVVGEYISRVNHQTTKRPHFVVKNER
jgi:glycosyltransferase involved in cell wall biosynthesis